MAPKKKKNKLLVKIVSGAGTGFFYLFKKTPAIAQKKIAIRKFDPIVNQYVVFNEAKLKYSTQQHFRPTFVQPAMQINPFWNPVNFGRVAAVGVGCFAAFQFGMPLFNNFAPTLMARSKPQQNIKMD